MRAFHRVLLALLLGAGVTAEEVLPAGFTDTVVATGLVYPTAMAAAPDGRLFICQQWGRVRVFKDGALLPTELVALPADGSGDRGLLGIAVDPAFATDHFLYVCYTEKPASTANDYVRNRVSRITVDGDVAVPGSETQLLETDLVYTVFHNGGPLHFGPDGKLYVGLGDGEEGAAAQRMTSVLGKILRIDSDGTIPADNPFLATTTGKYQAIWALGLRDPFSFAFRPSTGQMLIDDVGQNSWEEIELGAPGANYGWPAVEGAAGNPSYADPLYQYAHGDAWPSGDCVAGGVFYEPATAAFPPEYVGKYFFLDYSKGWIGTLDVDHGNATAVFATGLTGPVALCLGADGALYYATYNYNNPASTLHRIAFTTEAPAITALSGPATISDGGAATITVQATGTQPLSYQWRRDGVDIVGATGASCTLDPVTGADNGAAISVAVTNPYGAATSADFTLAVTPDEPPVCVITQPLAGSTYVAGQTIGFAGMATDHEDGDLPASAYSWRVDFITPDDPLAVLPATAGMTAGGFAIPTQGEPRVDVRYRITLTVTDSAGLQASTSVDIVPQVASLTVATIPAGMSVVLGGFPQRTTPYTVSAVAGQHLELAAMDPQILDGVDYRFASWSDDGGCAHEIVVPTNDASFTAAFVAAPPATTGGGTGTGTSASDTGGTTSAATTAGAAGASEVAASSGGGCGLGAMLGLLAGIAALGARFSGGLRVGARLAASTSQRLAAWSRRLRARA